ncbi:MAG: hypothetical protein AVDCRST_MAG59-1218, partial [uncultured Thermomicrobiales bacterium]
PEPGCRGRRRRRHDGAGGRHRRCPSLGVRLDRRPPGCRCRRRGGPRLEGVDRRGLDRGV